MKDLATGKLVICPLSLHFPCRVTSKTLEMAFTVSFHDAQHKKIVWGIKLARLLVMLLFDIGIGT